MADTRINAILGAKDEASKVVKGVRGQFETFKRDAMAGFGLGAGIGAFNLLSRGVGAVVDITGDAVRAFIEEEVAIRRLDAALQANIKGWDGNRDAIEGVITAREKLAFDDDSQRSSLALLVASTHDVTKALELQAIAMDLSRLRQTDLVETSVLMGKVYQGNLASLKRFGINLGNVKTSTQALAKVQELARGQAEAYAETIEGKVAIAQQKWNNMLEDAGAIIVGQLVPAVENLQSATDLDLFFNMLQSGLEGNKFAALAAQKAMAGTAHEYGMTEESLRSFLQHRFQFFIRNWHRNIYHSSSSNGPMLPSLRRP